MAPEGSIIEPAFVFDVASEQAHVTADPVCSGLGDMALEGEPIKRLMGVGNTVSQFQEREDQTARIMTTSQEHRAPCCAARHQCQSFSGLRQVNTRSS